jgi:small multidrug resistance pump
MTLPWIYLMIAIVFEVIGTMALKYASIHSSPIYTFITALGYIISFTLVYFAIKKLDIGLVYAIWAGMGTALIAILGVYLFNEHMNLLKAMCILMIIIGSMGLKFLAEQ